MSRETATVCVRIEEMERFGHMMHPVARLGGRALVGTGCSLLAVTVFTLVMLPLRGHLSIATTALVLVVPVVVGVAVGGFKAGALSVVVGFLVYDFFFIPPYLTLRVGAAENWAALFVYVIVMIPIARLVASTIAARSQAEERGSHLRRLLDVSSELIEDRPLTELLSTIVTTLRDTFDARQVALLLPRDGDLQIAVSAGDPLTDLERDRIRQLRGVTTHAGLPAGVDRSEPFGVALVAAGRPVGLLALTGAEVTPAQRETLHLFANQAALAIERAQLREQALRTELTDELERLARTMVAAVSHDLRSPLAAIKASSSILADHELNGQIDDDQRHRLAASIDVQTDRLARLVTNLLDMGRVQAGVLQPRTSFAAVTDLVREAVEAVPTAPGTPAPRIDVPDHLPPVDVDSVLITRVLANLLDNAYRHSPPGSAVEIAARPHSQGGGGAITVSVTDHGPGVSPERRNEIFGLYVRRSKDSGTGLGLAIAKTFIDAHQQRIWVETVPDGGARFCFTLPTADIDTTEG